ncbi:MAG: RluA family pseudouridine synthase [Oligosphaeraceae bacterium]|nr:RluA family pseudouridine synthase [Oligosphaeraceae bacterium]
MTHNQEIEFDDLQIDAGLVGLRLDRALAQNWPDKSRAFFQKLIADEQVLLNHKTCTNTAKRLENGDQIRVFWPSEPEYSLMPENIALDILYEDEDILVINKQAGIAVHPGAGQNSGTLVHALLHYAPEVFMQMNVQELRPGIVHRLDKDSSGVMVIAKNNRAETALKASFKQRANEKIYLAICIGGFQQTEGVIELPIARHPMQRKKMYAGHVNGKAAYTDYRVLDDNKQAALLKVNIITGRTHQIRVHLASIGHPIVGDRLYGGQKIRRLFLPQRQMLHAWKLSVTHPRTGEICRFQAKPAPDFIETMQKLQLQYSLKLDGANAVL